MPSQGHPDNVAAALLGGLTVSCLSGERVVAVSLPVPADLGWVVLVPGIESSTREARAVLPDTVTRADAVFNLQRMGLLLAALASGRADVLGVPWKTSFSSHGWLFPWMGPASGTSTQARWAASFRRGPVALRQFGVARPWPGHESAGLAA